MSERAAEAERQIRLATAVERLVEHQNRTNQDLTRIAGAIDGALIQKLPTEMSALREQLLNAFVQHRQAEQQALQAIATALDGRLDALAESVAKLESANTWHATEASGVRKLAEAAVTSAHPIAAASAAHGGDKHVGLIDRLDRVKPMTWLFAIFFLFALCITLSALLIVRGKYAPNTHLPILDGPHAPPAPLEEKSANH